MKSPARPPIRSGDDYANVEFRNVDLARCDLRDVAFADCVFERCSITEGTLAMCSFTGCTFRTCELSLAKFPGTRFMDVTWADSKLVGVNWTTVDLPARLGLSAAFERCVIDQAVFYGMNLRGLRLVDCRAREADFTGAEMTGAVCTGTDFHGARFGDATLVGADFRGATGYAIDPLRSRVAKARFSLPDAVALLDGLGVIID